MRKFCGLFLLLLATLLLSVVAAEATGETAKAEAPLAGNRVGSKTDDEVVEREADKIVADGFSIKDQKLIKEAEKFEFQAEVNRLMDIIINSLYSKKEIFLRELISNASDALDKIRFLSLTESSLLGEGETAKLEIKISTDKEGRTLSIQDRGIGMTKQDLINNLGTIAKSGTSKFLQNAGNTTDLNLIGQFGVGFYSVYLVADKVTVTTKNNADKQYIWESTADSSYTISEDPEGETLGRGTKITLHLKDDAAEYVDTGKLKDLIKRYSEYISFPIYLHESKEVDVEVPVEETPTPEPTEKAEGDEEKKDDETKDEDEAEVTEVDDKEDGEKKSKTKTVKETKWEWNQINDLKAIWTRDPKSVTEEEYSNFCKSVSKSFEDPLGHIHFKGEGDVEFKALLCMPGKAPSDLFDTYQDKNTNIKMFVKRVFITDEFDDLFPKYMKFIQGVVDSDDLPLNVSREMLQEHKMLKAIKKKLVRKVLELLKKLSDKAEKARKKKIAKEAKEKDGSAKTDEKKEEAVKDETKKEETKDEKKDEKKDEDVTKDETKTEEKKEEEKTEEKKEKKSDEDEDDEEEKSDSKEDPIEKYNKIWENFSKNIKLGVVEDQPNRARLSKLLRYFTSKSEDEQISLTTYVERMKPGQKQIYYISGENKDVVKESPFLERLLAKDYEVLYMIDPIDEYTVQHMTEFELDKETKYKLACATKEGLKIEDGDDKEKKKEKEIKEEYKPFTEWAKGILDSKIEKVVIGKRLTQSPAILATSQYGWSANMERIMKAQALSDPTKYNYMVSKKTFEVNPYHPIVKTLLKRVKDDKEDSIAKEMLLALYDQAVLQSGFPLEDPNQFSQRIQRLIKRGLDIDPDAKVDDEARKRDEEAASAEKDEPEKKEEEEEEEDDDTPPVHDEL
mmetsp:Transcript_39229/g.63604  ORF Transcript_39229/g.63604 Transcript_39229/m.63604 type:complete len:904 (+) Transcript_39229:105-2816(+)